MGPTDNAQTVMATDTTCTAKIPRLYHVVLLNDDVTPMDFVTSLLMVAFGHPRARATRIMQAVHKKGSGVAGTYPRDIAEAKLADIQNGARKHGFPLRGTLQPESR